MKSTVLAFTGDAILSVGTAAEVAREFGVQSGDCELQVITNVLSLGKLPVESSYFDAVISVSVSSAFPSGQILEEISRVLKPGGAVVVVYTNSQSALDKEISNLERQLLLAGFLEAQGLGQKPFGVKAKKPSWKIGSSFAIKKSQKVPLKIPIDDDSDLIDEDSLLTEEDFKKPQLAPVGDCEVGSTRKACANCTCGRAEAEEKVKLGLTAEQINNPQSACGNCELGDAFRCSTCPYKGLPPFKLGEKVALPGNFLAADF